MKVYVLQTTYYERCTVRNKGYRSEEKADIVAKELKEKYGYGEVEVFEVEVE